VQYKEKPARKPLYGALTRLTAHDHQTHRRFPERLAFTLDNRIRRFLEPPEELVSKLDLKQSDVVMDFGCGPGFYTIPLARTVLRTIAVDVSPHMLERAASNARRNSVAVELLRSDGTDLKLADESVDLIFLNHVFHEITEKPKVLAEFLRILRREGRLAVVERTRDGPAVGRFGPPIVDAAKVSQEIQDAGFTLVRTIQHGSNTIMLFSA